MIYGNYGCVFFGTVGPQSSFEVLQKSYAIDLLYLRWTVIVLLYELFLSKTLGNAFNFSNFLVLYVQIFDFCIFDGFKLYRAFYSFW